MPPALILLTTLTKLLEAGTPLVAMIAKMRAEAPADFPAGTDALLQRYRDTLAAATQQNEDWFRAHGRDPETGNPITPPTD